MSDLRHDPINDQWISVASNRRERPMEFVPIEQTRQQIICPFCKGNEDDTPGTLAAYRKNGTQLTEDDDPSSWTVRVIPNKYPSFSSRSAVNGSSKTKKPEATGPFDTCPSYGIQELIIPSPRHITTLSELTNDELTISFAAYQDRMLHAQSTDGIEHAMLFMNCRSAAGASLGHIHTQLIGSPVVSGHLSGRVSRCEEHFKKHGRSLIRTITDWEIKQQERIIEVTDNFCIVCPFASRFAFQIQIIPLKHETDFASCPAEMRDELAVHCRNLVSKIELLLDNPGYNMLIQIDPFKASLNGNGKSKSSHWYVEIFPRLTRAAGFEWGTDIWINPVAPEAAARQLIVRV